MQQYEYLVLRFDSEHGMEEALNQKAAKGWRLKQMVSIVKDRVSDLKYVMYAIMERSKENSK